MSPRKGRGFYTKKSDPRLARSRNPTPQELCWAAGIYEGEGTFGYRNVAVVQKEPWLPFKLQTLFGGSVKTFTDKRYPDRPYYLWRISGARARGFLMSIYELLSPHKQAQARPEFTVLGE